MPSNCLSIHRSMAASPFFLITVHGFSPRGQPAGTEPLRGVPSPCAASRAPARRPGFRGCGFTSKPPAIPARSSLAVAGGPNPPPCRRSRRLHGGEGGGPRPPCEQGEAGGQGGGIYAILLIESHPCFPVKWICLALKYT